MTLVQTDILDKSSRLFRKYGIRSVSMSDIASELGISKKTLYQYITDKESLIDKVLKVDYKNIEASLKSVINNTEDPIKQFIELQNIIFNSLVNKSGATGFELKKYYPEKYQYYFNNYITLFISILNQNLCKGIESGVYQMNLDASLIVKIYIASLLNVFDNDLFDLQEYLSEKHISESLKYHLRAIVIKKYIDTIDNYFETKKSVIS